MRVRVAVPTGIRYSAYSNHKPGWQTLSLKGQIPNNASSVGHTTCGDYSTKLWGR